MRTYVLSIANLHTRQRATFRCEAASFSEALSKAQSAKPGFGFDLFFGGLSHDHRAIYR